MFALQGKVTLEKVRITSMNSSTGANQRVAAGIN